MSDILHIFMLIHCSISFSASFLEITQMVEEIANLLAELGCMITLPNRNLIASHM